MNSGWVDRGRAHTVVTWSSSAAAFVRRLTALVLGAAALIFAFAWSVRGFGAEEAFLAVVGIAVAAIPEGLLTVLTITLAIGVRRVAARHASIRQLPAVETLGAFSIICSDKTGTPTRHETMVEAAETRAGRFAIAGEGCGKPALGRRLSGLDLLAVQIDGIRLAEDLPLVAAVGIDGEGTKHPLGLVEGTTENAAIVQALLDDLATRGLPATVRRQNAH